VQVDPILGEQLPLAPGERWLEDRVDGGKDHAPAVPAVGSEGDRGLVLAVDKHHIDGGPSHGPIGPRVVVALGDGAAEVLAVGLVRLGDGRQLWHVDVRHDELHLLERRHFGRQRVGTILDDDHARGTCATLDGCRAVMVRVIPVDASHVIRRNLVRVLIRRARMHRSEDVISWRLAVDVQPVRVHVGCVEVFEVVVERGRVVELVGKIVREPDMESVAGLHTNSRAGQLVVVRAGPLL
jgi:hypothetical protein